ncbi:MAG: enoyl-CoA hydratase-related protein, partial [Smithellaceae bacterium]|nr:enoyl-CoA hydratase-related protein [Smithellaceae bacterium]
QGNVTLEIDGHIGIVTLNHPPANAFNLATMEDLEEILDQVQEDKNIRVVIITGGGEKGFSAGFDVSDAANAHKTAPKGRVQWTRIDRFSKPIIAAINGFALGGGCELALACHFRLMSDSPKAFIGLTELNLGIIPGWGGTQRMMRQVGRSKAMELILLSRRLSGREALEIGLVDQVAAPEELRGKALELARALAEKPPIAVGCVLRAMSAGQYEGIEAGLRAEEEGSAQVTKSRDAMEGFAAFLEKRKPNFTGE